MLYGGRRDPGDCPGEDEMTDEDLARRAEEDAEKQRRQARYTQELYDRAADAALDEYHRLHG